MIFSISVDIKGIMSRIKIIRDFLGVTQTELARLLKVSPSAVSEFENGVRVPSKRFVFGLSDLGISVDWFINGKGEMLEKNKVTSKPLDIKNNSQKVDLLPSSSLPDIPLVEDMRELVKETMEPELEKIHARLQVLESHLKLSSAKGDSSAEPIPMYDNAIPYAREELIAAETSPKYGEDETEDYEEVPHVWDIAAGPPITMVDDPGETTRVPRRMLRKGGRYYTANIRGGSMTERGIRDGDTVLIRHADVPIDDAIMAVSHQGKSTLKRLRQRGENRWELHFEDGTGRVIPVDSDEYKVQGEYVGIVPGRRGGV